MATPGSREGTYQAVSPRNEHTRLQGTGTPGTAPAVCTATGAHLHPAVEDGREEQGEILNLLSP